MVRRPTMNDVASSAGVALRTVSRFVNGETNIDPALAERIAKAIDQLGYRRNLSAASIRPGWSSKTIGLVISDLANPYYAVLSRAVEQAAAEAGYMVMISSSEEDADRHDRIVDRMLDQRVDALIVVSPRTAGRDWSKLTPHVPPVVFVDRPNPYPGGFVIVADNRGGSTAAVLALANVGAKRIAFLGDATSIYTMSERYQGYAEALKLEGIPLDPTLVLDTAHDVGDAASATEAIIELGADAIFAANNRATVGVLAAFGKRGFRVPLIGFDDFEGASLHRPGVSVVSQDVARMGRLAMERVLHAIGGGSNTQRWTTLPTSLILRGSEVRAHP